MTAAGDGDQAAGLGSTQRECDDVGGGASDPIGDDPSTSRISGDLQRLDRRSLAVNAVVHHGDRLSGADRCPYRGVDEMHRLVSLGRRRPRGRAFLAREPLRAGPQVGWRYTSFLPPENQPMRAGLPTATVVYAAAVRARQRVAPASARTSVPRSTGSQKRGAPSSGPPTLWQGRGYPKLTLPVP
jgi:hypothetical protein